MSMPKRLLTFAFIATTAFSFFAYGPEATAQSDSRHQALPMPSVFRLSPAPYEPPASQKLTREEQTAIRNEKRAWSAENRKALTLISKGKSLVKTALAEGGDVTSNAEALKFLENYTFPSMTQTDPDTLSSLGTKRQEFLKNYLNDRVTGTARVKMIDLSIEKLQAQSIDPTLHPSARVNAVVLMRQLTDRPLSRGQAPIASAKALKVLLAIVDGKDEKQYPEFLKIAALSGINYQLDINSEAQQSLAPGDKTQLVSTISELIAAPVDPEKGAGAYWQKRQAVQLAGVIKASKMLPLLLAILDDDASSLPLKLDVVQAIAKGAVGNSPKNNSDALLSICKFAESAIGGEAVRIQEAVDQMVRNGILFGTDDLKATGADFEPENAGLNNRLDNRFDGPSGKGKIVELPNYELGISRNRLRSVAMFCQQAIGTSNQTGLRQNLDTKAETLASRTVGQLNSLMVETTVGLIDVERRRVNGEPTAEDEDRFRQRSYVDQMIKVCNDSAGALAAQLANYTSE